MGMNLSPHYPTIKSRAVELLRAGSINNHPYPELLTFAAGGNRSVDWWILNNTVDVALCMARDEILDEDGFTLACVRGRSRFNKGNHSRAKAEIISELSEQSLASEGPSADLPLTHRERKETDPCP